jgi:2,4-dienoyl-CoA reductase-like NADH-dependent reductase (Old Yellow Enzyme family)
MNERFWELVEQADEQGGDDPDIRDEVFAKLIVQECIDLIGAGGEFVSRPKLVEKLQEHFGVE